ncbi:hypothetical protein VTO73DRAFT_12248 [Trametes versicolor]
MVGRSASNTGLFDDRRPRGKVRPTATAPSSLLLANSAQEQLLLCHTLRCGFADLNTAASELRRSFLRHDP